MQPNKIIELLNDPHGLESLYRQDSGLFKKWLIDARQQMPDEPTLTIWYERLYYTEPLSTTSEFWVMGGLAILAGLISRGLLWLITEQYIAGFYLFIGIFSVIMVYLLYRSRPQRWIVISLGLLMLLTIGYLAWLPLTMSDPIILIYLHLPVFLWLLTGWAYVGNDYQQWQARMKYITHNGAFGIIYAMMAIVGILLTALTIQLFNLMGWNIAEWYFENIVIIGVAALAVVSVYLVVVHQVGHNITPYLAKLFGPLLLVTLVIYLLASWSRGSNPFTDRDFLLVFNGILLFVLAVGIFSITESDDQTHRIMHMLNLALLLVALLIDGIALMAIILRLTTYGLSINRIAVLGVNLCILGHLLVIGKAYLAYYKYHQPYELIAKAICDYLPVYAVWSAVVIFVFPILFS